MTWNSSACDICLFSLILSISVRKHGFWGGEEVVLWIIQCYFKNVFCHIPALAAGVSLSCLPYPFDRSPHRCSGFFPPTRLYFAAVQDAPGIFCMFLPQSLNEPFPQGTLVPFIEELVGNQGPGTLQLVCPVTSSPSQLTE